MPVKRLNAMEKINTGMKLADIDLEIRGPGEIYGTAQHGFPELKIASFSDFDLIRRTRQAAEETIYNLQDHPLLQERLKQYKIRYIKPN